MGRALRLGVAFIVSTFLVAGCGNLVSPGVKVVTDPPGATVRFGSEKIGETPVLIPIDRIEDEALDTLTLVISKEGYVTRRLALSQREGILRVSLEKKKS